MPKSSRTDWKHLAAMPDEDIDFSEIPEQGPEFFKNAILRLPEPKSAITIRVDPDILEWFKKSGPGYQTRINAVLKMYVDAQKSTKPAKRR